jgi:hypothetical protein
MLDRVAVLTFAMGHGDCLLIEVVQAGRGAFRLLYDGAANLQEELLLHLRSNRKDSAVKGIVSVGQTSVR